MADSLLSKIEAANEDHARVSAWKKDAPRGSHEWTVWRNRQWAIKRKINRYSDALRALLLSA